MGPMNDTPPPQQTKEERRESRVHTLFDPPSCEVSESMAPWRVTLHNIIFEAETPWGAIFDKALLWLILISVLAVMLESVPSLNASMGPTLRVVEWVVTGLFTIEYVLRLLSVRRPLGYVRSFFGVVDLLSVIPTYLSLFFAGAHVLAVIRILRVLRFFRLFKLSLFVGEAEQLTNALLASTRKIVVFMGFVLTIVVIIGSFLYFIEGAEAGFDSIPRSIYWAIVTLTTVGYGDIAPQTPLGQAVAAIVMITGYAIIAIPTGIVTAEVVSARYEIAAARTCPSCAAKGHDNDARHCKFCGSTMP